MAANKLTVHLMVSGGYNLWTLVTPGANALPILPRFYVKPNLKYYNFKQHYKTKIKLKPANGVH